MTIKSLAKDAVNEIAESVAPSLSESDAEAVERIIEEKLVEAIVHSSKRCASAAAIACGAESDLAHKIAKEVDLAQNALIANLKSMR